MTRNTEQRLGCRPQGDGIKELQRHPWFQSIDWESLEHKELISPFIPDVSKYTTKETEFVNFLPQSKKANFDSTHELEELLLEDNPLKARKRKANQDLNSLSAEMRQMEEQ